MLVKGATDGANAFPNHIFIDAKTHKNTLQSDIDSKSSNSF